LHDHDFVEIVYVLDGSGEEIVDGHSYDVRRGDLVFIYSGSSHSFRSDGNLEYYNICFAPEVIGARIDDRREAIYLLSLRSLAKLRGEGEPIGLLHFYGEERASIEFLLKEMEWEYRNEFLEGRAVLESYLTVLLSKILRKTQENDTVEGKCLNGIWRALSEFIDENIEEKLTLSSLAEKYFYNPSYFSRAFKKQFGVSLAEYLAKERLSVAEELLKTSSLSVEEISARCGYGDKASLYRVFEKHYGCTPTEFRKRNK
jgi:AraC-like DNA-binding protein